jgi:hypothetical protein
MTLHLIKLAVGIDGVAHLREVQARRRATGETLWHPTRHAPKRAEALLDGGSLYWVIRGVIRVRQRLIGLEPATPPLASGDGKARVPVRRCLLLLDPVLVTTVPRTQRPFQGWRYLRSEDAPADAAAGTAGDEEAKADLPAAMVAELAKLGLL